jgi:type II secretory ATPase GspE/PulE/Tfp pilus assembly ATPase PilB-like protein
MQDPWKRLALNHRRPFLNEVKNQANLSIAVSGRPQDGRAHIDDLLLDLRVNLLPMLHGEKIVLRLLDLTREFRLDALGIHDEAMEALKDVAQFKNGVVLISGPTGSGKTTTLYSLLCSLDARAKNIVTLEDPVEYGIEGLNQVPIDRKVSFAGALRAVLRQDPDVILVGEIRDEETAALAFKAAATGHLVLSTIHANGAAEVIDRLVNLGVDRLTIATNLRLSAAQRLVRTLCLRCSRPANESALERLGQRFLSNATDRVLAGHFRVPGGVACTECRKGYVGRVPILEVMTQDDVTKYLSGGHTKGECLSHSIDDACLHHAALGQIDVREVGHVA